MSNRRKRIIDCQQPGCGRDATVHVSAFDDNGTVHGEQWLCDRHAEDVARRFPGRIWGDAQCDCGHIDHVIKQAGRTKDGEL